MVSGNFLSTGNHTDADKRRLIDCNRFGAFLDLPDLQTYASCSFFLHYILIALFFGFCCSCLSAPRFMPVHSLFPCHALKTCCTTSCPYVVQPRQNTLYNIQTVCCTMCLYCIACRSIVHRHKTGSRCGYIREIRQAFETGCGFSSESMKLI